MAVHKRIGTRSVSTVAQDGSRALKAELGGKSWLRPIKEGITGSKAVGSNFVQHFKLFDTREVKLKSRIIDRKHDDAEKKDILRDSNCRSHNYYPSSFDGNFVQSEFRGQSIRLFIFNPCLLAVRR